MSCYLVLCLLGTVACKVPHTASSLPRTCVPGRGLPDGPPESKLSRHLSELHGARTRANRSLRSYVPDKYVLILPPIGTHQCMNVSLAAIHPILSSLQLIQMLQPRQHHLLTRLLDLARQKNLIQNRIHFIEIKHKVQFTDISEELIQHLHKEMDRF